MRNPRTQTQHNPKPRFPILKAPRPLASKYEGCEQAMQTICSTLRPQKATRMGNVRPAWDESSSVVHATYPLRLCSANARNPPPPHSNHQYHRRITTPTMLSSPLILPSHSPTTSIIPHAATNTHPGNSSSSSYGAATTAATPAAQRHSSGSSNTAEPRGAGEPPHVRHHINRVSSPGVLRCSRTEHPVSRALWQHPLIKHWSGRLRLAMAPRKETRARRPLQIMKREIWLGRRAHHHFHRPQTRMLKPKP